MPARYVYYGIREFGMAAAMNGMALHGGIIPYGGTFLVFADYCRNAIRIGAAAPRVIYVLTHDSIGLGEDGPTHQPIETVMSLRMIPNFRCSVRPTRWKPPNAGTWRCFADTPSVLADPPEPAAAAPRWRDAQRAGAYRLVSARPRARSCCWPPVRKWRSRSTSPRRWKNRASAPMSSPCRAGNCSKAGRCLQGGCAARRRAQGLDRGRHDVRLAEACRRWPDHRHRHFGASAPRRCSTITSVSPPPRSCRKFSNAWVEPGKFVSSIQSLHFQEKDHGDQGCNQRFRAYRPQCGARHSRAARLRPGTGRDQRPGQPKANALLFKRDSVHGAFPAPSKWTATT
jgi:hypothetical protein